MTVKITYYVSPNETIDPLACYVPPSQCELHYSNQFDYCYFSADIASASIITRIQMFAHIAEVILIVSYFIKRVIP